jgi:hypothetical protein
VTRLIASIQKQQPGRIHLAGSATLFLIVVVFSGLALPAWARWNQRCDVELQLRSASKELSLTQGKIAATRKALAAATPGDATALNLLSATFDNRVLMISDAASATHVAVESVESKQPVASVRGIVVVNANGRYEHILSWLDTLHRTAPDLKVHSVRLSSAGNHICSCRLTFSWSPPPVTNEALSVRTQEGAR